MFQKSESYFKIPGSRKVTWSTFCTGDSDILAATVQKSVVREPVMHALWRDRHQFVMSDLRLVWIRENSFGCVVKWLADGGFVITVCWLQWQCTTNATTCFEDSVLLGYTTASLPNWFPVIQDNVLVSFSRVRMSTYFSWTFQPFKV